MMRRMLRAAWWIGSCGICLLLACVALPAFRLALGYLPTGWWLFLKRSVSTSTVNWNGVALAALCAGLAVPLLHFFLRMAKDWRLRWTLCMFALFCWLFILVMASSGLFRALQWLASKDEPLFTERTSPRLDLSDASIFMTMAMIDSDRAGALWANMVRISCENGSRGFNAMERCQFVIKENPDGTVANVLVMPRHIEAQKQYGGFVLGGTVKRRQVTGEELLEIVAALR